MDEAQQLGFNREQLISIKIFALPYFDFDNYVALIRSHISILSNICWGGVTYNALGLKFRSPLINMFELEEDYMKILSDPKHYFGMKLQFDSWGNNSNGAYPICRLGDVRLHCNHSKSIDEVEAKWYDRVERLNYDNLFVMMCTERKDILKEFSNLPYKKKVCFVPFDSSYDCACTLKFADRKPNVPFWYFVNGIPSGEFNDYNMISLLNNGTVKHDRVSNS